MEGTWTRGDGRFRQYVNNLKLAVNPRHALTMLALRQYIAEFIATGLFVFAATGSIIAVQAAGGAPLGIAADLVVAVAFGFVAAAMIYATSNVSGGHINPAVTITMMATGNMNLLKGVFYVAAQILGACVGSAFLRALTPEAFWRPVDVGTVRLGPGMNQGMGFVMEIILTFGLVYTVFGTSVFGTVRSHKRGGWVWARLAGLAVGLATFICYIVGRQFSGAGINPARAFGPFLASGFWPHYAWIYFLGPIIGGILAGFLYQFFLQPTVVEPSPDNDEKERDRAERVDEAQTAVGDQATAADPNPV